ncbi:MAG: hypothetical protein V8S24_05855 [Gordonibacter pamelaeae]
MRFFLLVTNLSSVMAWGVVLIGLFLVVAFVYLVILVVKKNTPKALDIVGLVLSVCVAALHRRAAGRRGRGVPAVEHGRPADPLRGVGGFDGFRSLRLAPRLAAPDEAAGLPLLAKAGLVLPVLELVLVVVLLAVTVSVQGSAAEAAAASVGALVSGAYAVPFWVGFVGIGLVRPFALSLLGRRKAGAGEQPVSARRWP